ncbi:MAG: tRNA (guanosine(37)-N1)-methyltransferase TrmD [Anaerolineae bacterium]|jgi:tRNA (guanine37-N1)-methyltransferase|nr:tRNA (guanosine(37)-N1)-methyltransferase TrmD [Anaerolineae bacterium]
MYVDVLTLFPGMFLGPLQESILKRAQERGHLTIVIHQLRDYALDRHQLTDDLPYGGGEGMLLKPEPILRAVEAIRGIAQFPVVLLSPQGRTFNQAVTQELAQHSRLLLICGHYEGFDERVRIALQPDEISIGDYVLTGGELPAMVMIDALARWIPGVLGDGESAQQDSFASGLLEGPQYTRPLTYGGIEVPAVLRSGNHAAISRWRRQEALRRTWLRRPELLARMKLNAEERAFVAQLDKPPANQSADSDGNNTVVEQDGVWSNP